MFLLAFMVLVPAFAFLLLPFLPLIARVGAGVGEKVVCQLADGFWLRVGQWVLWSRERVSLL